MTRRAALAAPRARTPGDAGEPGSALELRAGPVTAVLFAVYLLLLLAHLAGLVARYRMGYPAATGWIALFNFDTEANLPTWFSSILFAAAALILALVARWKRSGGDRFARHWSSLAVLFLFLTVDEACSLHERLNDVAALQRALRPSGALYYPWVAVYLALLGVLGAAYLRFLRSLPRRTGVAFVLAALLYVGGAAGFEMLGAAQDERHGRDNLAYAGITTFEETLEMLGALVFIHALLAYPAKAEGRLLVRVGGARG